MLIVANTGRFCPFLETKMKHCNWLDWDSDGNAITIRPNNAIAGTPLISLSVEAGGFMFIHTMRLDQARELARDLAGMADGLTPVILEEVTV